MRILYSITLILIISLISFQEAVVYLGFKMGQDFIAANYCVEKDIKDSDCLGSCCLIKMVSDSKDRQDTNVPLPSFEPIKINLFFQDIEFTRIHFAHFQDSSGFYQNFKDSEFIPSLLRPPIC